MESIVQQLSQDDRSISLDAYQTLSSVVREYDEIPDEAELRTKIPVILKYIRRDLLRQLKPDEPQIADTNLITQALKVLVIFVWSRDYSSLLPEEYRTFIIDRSIQVITEHTAPKSVIIHYLHLLATQDFRPGLVTSNNRVPRLLEALKTLTEHVKGNGAVSERLLVYQKLLEQAKPMMKAKANLWVEELLTGMTSALKDIRTKAMALGWKSCSVFSAASSISTPVRSILRQEFEQEKTFSSTLCRRLEKMLGSKDEAIHVPQIWAIVLLLTNGLDARIEELKDWLKVIQKCFNSSESAVRQQANMAWNRFTYLVRPHEASEALLTMLVKPLSAQLERHGAEHTLKNSRATAVSSYCNLLYYAFRPAATHKQYTRVWNEYIVKVMKSSLFEKNSANSDLACRILITLLWNSNRGMKLWNENRALENTLVEPEELPTIDYKWIRARSIAILGIFKVLLRYSSWGAFGQSDRAYIAIAWTHFLKALREAGSKEIKPSQETTSAVTNVTNFLGLLYTDLYEDQLDRNDHGHPLSIGQIRQLTFSAVSELGYELILIGLDGMDGAFNKTLLLCGILNSILSELNQALHDEEQRLHSQGSRNSFQFLLSQYEKCLELLNSALVKELAEEEERKNPAMTISSMKEVDQILQNAPGQELVRTLSLIQAPLVVMLKDDSGYGGSEDRSLSGEETHPNFTKNCLCVLAKVPSAALTQLDELFATPFESKHESVVGAAVEMWNNHFGNMESLDFGPLLLAALLKLRDDSIDIVIPGAPKQAQSLIHAALPFEESHTPASARRSCLSPEQVERLQPSPILSGYGVVSDGDEAISSSAERPMPQSRPRHDDSQIHFVPIESSPLPQQAPDSQFLTEHQKEVRDRQRSEPAVVFPDLRSSPRLQSKSQNHGDCEFARKAAALPERPSTPTLPTSHDNGEPEIQASPTPRARHVANQITDVEVPSSPPSMPDNQDKDGTDGDTMSSPLPHAADGAHIGIDLAITLSEVAPEASAIEEEGCPNEATLPQDMEGSQNDDTHEPDENELQMSECAVLLPGFPFDRTQETTADKTDIVMNAEAEHEALIKVSGPGTDSDDIDMLSASQLSQDLDRHISLASETAEAQDCLQEMISVQPETEEEQPKQKVSSQRKRKRKSGSLRFTMNKRRRSKSASQSSSSFSLEAVSSEYDIPAPDLVDCIEVAPSRAVQAIEGSDLTTKGQTNPAEPLTTPSRRRTRRRRGSQNSQLRELTEAQTNVVVPEAAHGELQIKEEIPIENRGVDITVQEYLDTDTEPRDQGREMNLIVTPEVGEVREGVELDDSIAREENSRATSANVDVQPNIMASLQNVLDRLKAGDAGDVDLRTVDELCFQIRFQAQVIAQRPG